MNKHITNNYILNPQHPITVAVIGAGGTGSNVVTQLARLNQALIGLGHMGLIVTLYDSDIVQPHNIGRQNFSPSDIDCNKASVLITRLNRFFNTNWNAEPYHYTDQSDVCNITITCTDTISSRKMVKNALSKWKRRKYKQPYNKPIYWLDIGNTYDKGQFVLSTIDGDLPDTFELFKQLQNQVDEDDIPSCSMIESLNKQDLFMNSLLAQMAVNLLWKMFRHGSIEYHGAFLNLSTLQTSTIKI